MPAIDADRRARRARRARRPRCARRRAARGRGSTRPERPRATAPARRRPSTIDDPRDRGGDQPVEEAALDLQRSGDPRRDAAEQQRLQSSRRRAGSRGSRGRPGSPGRSVVRCRPPTLTARNSEGKMTQRSEELRAAQRVAQRPPRERDSAPRITRRASASADAPSRALEVAAGLLHEDVVERGLDELERRDRDSPPRRARARRRRSRRRPRSTSTERCSSLRRLGAATPKRSSTARAADLVGRRASVMSRCGRPTSALSAAGVPSATISPAVDDPDAVGELVGLLEVLRGQEDRRALVRAGAGPPPTASCATPGPGRSSARRGTAPRARGSAPSRGRDAGACRPE